MISEHIHFNVLTNPRYILFSIFFFDCHLWVLIILCVSQVHWSTWAGLLIWWISLMHYCSKLTAPRCSAKQMSQGACLSGTAFCGHG